MAKRCFYLHMGSPWRSCNVQTAKKSMFAAPFPVGFKLALELRGFKMDPAILPLAYADAYQVSIVRFRLKMLMDPLLEPYGETTI
jgi:hypothetical protein